MELLENTQLQSNNTALSILLILSCPPPPAPAPWLLCGERAFDHLSASCNILAPRNVLAELKQRGCLAAGCVHRFEPGHPDMVGEGQCGRQGFRALPTTTRSERALLGWSRVACLLVCLPACLPACLLGCLLAWLLCLIACLVVCLVACVVAWLLACFLASLFPCLLPRLHKHIVNAP